MAQPSGWDIGHALTEARIRTPFSARVSARTDLAARPGACGQGPLGSPHSRAGKLGSWKDEVSGDGPHLAPLLTAGILLGSGEQVHPFRSGPSPCGRCCRDHPDERRQCPGARQHQLPALPAWSEASVLRGLAQRSPVRITIPRTGHWHAVVDMQGLRGNTRASIRVVPGSALRPLPPIKEYREEIAEIAGHVAEVTHATGGADRDQGREPPIGNREAFGMDRDPLRRGAPAGDDPGSPPALEEVRWAVLHAAPNEHRQQADRSQLVASG